MTTGHGTAAERGRGAAAEAQAAVPGLGGALSAPGAVAPEEEAPTSAALAAAPAVVADTVGEYARGWLARLRGGDTGMLPVIVGLVIIAVIFQVENSKFLSPNNLVNLIIYGSVFMVLALGEIFALLLGEIDLSLGYVAGIGGVIAAELVKQQTGWPWGAAVAVALVACTAIGLLQGALIALLNLPSFVVTLAGQLFWLGVMLVILGNGGTLVIQSAPINDLANGTLTPLWGWILAVAFAAVSAVVLLGRDRRRRSAGLTVPPFGVTAAKAAVVAAAALLLALLCNVNRGVLTTIEGIPWVVVVVLGLLGLWTFLLTRTRFGRYVYSVGGNAEASRRAGVSLAGIRILAFTLAGLSAGVAGLLYSSYLRSVSTNIQGGTLVLDAVAAAVIGGTSLFGGRGKMIHAILGGVVIAAIANGMALLGLSAALQNIVTALVLLAAVVVDSLARRGSTARR